MITSADWTSTEWDRFAQIVSGSALGRANHDEILKGFEFLASQGYHIIQDTQAALEGADA